MREGKLTLAVVMEILQELFGYGSMISSTFIREVRAEDADTCPTLSIDPQGVLRYNPGFFAEHVNTERKLKEVVLHELLHPVLGDMHRRTSYIANFASDMVINALVGKVLGHCDIMEEMYPDKVPDEEGTIAGLLRPETTILAESLKYESLYKQLWRSWGTTVGYYNPGLRGMQFRERDVDSIEEVREVVEVLMSRYQGPPVLLIGGHGHRVNDAGGRRDPMESSIPVAVDGNFDDISGELKEILADEICDLLSRSAGYGDSLVEMAVETIRANVTLVRKLLEDFSATSEFHSFRRYMKTRKRRRGVFPRQLSRRDAVLLGAGVTPVFYQTARTHLSPEKDGMNVYVDVSGSMWGYLPKILGFLQAVRGFTDGIFQFSNQVVPVTLREMFRCKGKAKISSTGGTDYNCIIEHAVGAQCRKIVVMTDGFADCDVKHKALCLANIEKACVVYSEHHAEDEFWRRNYHRSYDLHELFRGCS